VEAPVIFRGVKIRLCRLSSQLIPLVFSIAAAAAINGMFWYAYADRKLETGSA
jgi:UV DNA damage repair endonuclease